VPQILTHDPALHEGNIMQVIDRIQRVSTDGVDRDRATLGVAEHPSVPVAGEDHGWIA
jgi:hypothetical protein